MGRIGRGSNPVERSFNCIGGYGPYPHKLACCWLFLKGKKEASLGAVSTDHFEELVLFARSSSLHFSSQIIQFQN